MKFVQLPGKELVYIYYIYIVVFIHSDTELWIPGRLTYALYRAILV